MTYREAYMDNVRCSQLAADVHKRLCPVALRDFGYRINPIECKKQKPCGEAECRDCWDAPMCMDEMPVAERAAFLAEKFVEEFGGITYPEWYRLREGVDAIFRTKQREAEKSLCLCLDDEVGKFIRSQFG